MTTVSQLRSVDNHPADAFTCSVKRSKAGTCDSVALYLRVCLLTSLASDRPYMSMTVMQSAPKVLGNAGKKKSADAWTLSQSSKSPAKVAAARKGLEGKLSQSRKSSQVSTWLRLRTSTSRTTSCVPCQVHVRQCMWLHKCMCSTVLDTWKAGEEPVLEVPLSSVMTCVRHHCSGFSLTYMQRITHTDQSMSVRFGEHMKRDEGSTFFSCLNRKLLHELSCFEQA